MTKRSGISLFRKTFLYMLLFLFIVICITAVLFAQQFFTAYDAGRKQQLMDMIQPLCVKLEGKSKEQIIEHAKAYQDKNTSVQFTIQTVNGEVIYETCAERKNIEIEHNPPPVSMQNGNVAFNSLAYIFPLSDDITLYVYYTSDTELLAEILSKTAFTFGILLIITVIGAVIFARKITNPIKKLADDTTKMSNLEYVPAPAARKDEIGRLAEDVHKMYEHLKRTISQLESEIEREKEMEENQRYFFSAASHELKTPVAAASTMLESMLEEWVELSEYPKYLQECLKMMKTQGKLISEIMDIVRLGDEKMQLDIQPVNLQETIEALLPVYQPLSESKELHINLTLSDYLACAVDRHLFSRVLSNLLMNAVQNTPNKGEIRIRSEVQSERIVRLSIINTQTNINEELLSKIFEPFYRLDQSRTQKGRSGLGLTIVKKALDAMKIPFALENSDEGVLFWMDIPLAE